MARSMGTIILRPHFSSMEESEEKAREILDASREAGRQLVGDGMIPPDMFRGVSQPLVSQDDWMGA